MTVTSSEPQARGRRIGGLLAASGVVLGGALVVAGSFLPWSVGRDEPMFAVGWQGVDGWMPNDAGMLALVVLAAGVVMIVGGVLTGRNPTWWKGTALAAVIAGVVGWAAFGSAVHTFGMFSHPPGFSFGEHLDVPGRGLWVILAGAVVGGVASVLRRALRSGPPAAT